MRGLAGRLGLRFCATTGDRGYQDEVGEMTPIGILAGEPPERITDLMHGRYLDRNIQVFNLHLGSYPEDPSSPIRSCVLVTFAATFPRLSIAPHTRMSKLRLGRDRQWLSFAPEPFRQRFDIQAPDNETARSILSDDLVGWLMAGRDDVRITLEDGGLLGHVAHLDEDDAGWEPFIDFVVGFHGAIPAQAWADYSLFGGLG
jgi:hypothetical protein